MLERARTGKWFAMTLIAGVMGWASQGSATTIVNFDGTGYLTNSSHPSLAGAGSTFALDVDNDGSVDDLRRIRGFNETTPMNPSAANGYDVNQTSAVFYGGWQSDRKDVTTWTGGNTNMWFVDGGASNDNIQFSTNTSTGTTGNFKGLMVWEKSDFLGVSSGQTVQFDDTSSISFLPVVGTGLYNFNFVVKNGGTFYISQYTFGINSSTDGSVKSLDLLGLSEQTSGKQWAVYSPSDTSIGFSSSSATFAPVDFNDVQAVGILVQRDYATSATIYAAVSAFSASATVIAPSPEPATLALLAIGGVTLLAGRHKSDAA